MVQGTVLAPSETADWHGKNHLIKFTEPTNCSVLGVSGTASIDGVGAVWWASEAAGNSSRPDLLIFKGMHSPCSAATVYSQTSLIRLSSIPIPHHLEENRWLLVLIYSICHVHIQYCVFDYPVPSPIRIFFCGKQMCAVN